MTTRFFSGTVQEGIDKAVSESKYILCFITDGGDICHEWERVLVETEKIRDLLKDKAIVMKLESESQETSFLRAYFPTRQPPNLAIMTPTSSRILLSSDMDVKELGNAICEYLKDEVADAGGSSGHVLDRALPTEAGQESVNAQATNRLPDLIPDRTRIQQQLDARRTRLEIEKKEADEQAKIEKARKTEARKEAASDPKRANELKYAKMRRNRLNEEKKERERIMKLVEDDKLARRARGERQQKQQQHHHQENEQEVVTNAATVQSCAPKESITPNQKDICALQVRLFDGRSIRSDFSPKATIAEDVRLWIDKANPGPKPAFSFKHMQSPTLHRSIDVLEESTSLEGLKLMPNATLSLVPIKDFSNAYDEANQGLFAKSYNVLTSGIGFVGSTVARVTGYANNSSNDGNGTHAPATDSAKGQRNIRTFAEDQSGRREQYQLYNGNQLNFEPRPEDDLDDQ
ncbi:MAG: hypothetical protein M1814_006284 [Vezdaea aestivalis]|nr:MAG: hypothetical protein M1814_006284 [Vezdaea aestivalis]